jgi:hypothetical protein
MSGSNDFLPFGTGGSANVLSQAAWLALLSSTIPNGFSDGIADPATCNKLFRQSSFVAAAVAQLMCDTLGVNILDDGNLAEFEANLKATLQAIGRIKLTANTTFYVSASGSDANGGLTSGTPWATLQHAWNTIATQYDLNGFVATVNVSGALTVGLQAVGALVGGACGVIGQQPFVLNFLAGSSLTASSSAIIAAAGTVVSVMGSGTLSASAGNTLYAIEGGQIYFSGITFGPASGNHITAQQGGVVQALGSYTITGGAGGHLVAANSASINGGGFTVTLSGTPAFSSAFASATIGSSLQMTAVTYSGSATGQRYVAAFGGTINTNGGGANYFPGSSAGSATTGFYN